MHKQMLTQDQNQIQVCCMCNGQDDNVQVKKKMQYDY